ncbi:hypothetical protein [Elizabethkingia meningoseptica]|uniref:hypothetical protein n=1 Tax=Elizabethkingia meningoseptica TaxID=238 RepID=UPI001625050E|nr:hypothetical protein [Elizabethkingia meningoseptica]
MKEDFKSLLIVIVLATVCVSLSHFLVIPIIEHLIPNNNKIESEKLRCNLGKTLYKLEIIAKFSLRAQHEQ